jgi:site-specific DNA-methyltransferase (adenine-specific)
MTDRKPYFDDGTVRLYGGDALAVLAALPDASVDAVITDPPYSSGGQFRSDRMGGTRAKYVNSDSASGQALAEFSGDNRDQRAYGYWCSLWLSECLRVTRPAGACILFTDWRQLPITTDALQAGGWVWRGVVPWAKPDARPQAGRFTASCECAVWGSAGPMPIPLDGSLPCLPGFYQARSPRDREHIAQKPLSVMRDLVKIAPKGGTVLDPFMGAGTTGVAAVIEGRNFTGAELASHHQGVARDRILAARLGYRDNGIQGVLLGEAGAS